MLGRWPIIPAYLAGRPTSQILQGMSQATFSAAVYAYFTTPRTSIKSSIETYQ
jgi:hypothetical protein